MDDLLRHERARQRAKEHPSFLRAVRRRPGPGGFRPKKDFCDGLRKVMMFTR